MQAWQSESEAVKKQIEPMIAADLFSKKSQVLHCGIIVADVSRLFTCKRILLSVPMIGEMSVLR